ncbi:MAG: Rieske 2Fe-2S domain-containing protein [Rhodobacteraceae bacterium]|nr:Rieske 2Fe-2S domain-containing protein [Paracoccaceae bacterium]
MDWIAVGLCADVPARTVVPRRVLNTDLAIWCSTAGVFHAWGDRCPHRGMRLSHGFVRGETLSCIYHGWTYDGDGACVSIPAHPDLVPPKSICAAQYDCQVADELIWVALQPTQAPVPDLGARRAIRSIDVALPAQTVAAKLNQPFAPVIALGGVHDLSLALQPSTDADCLLHAFAAPDQDRKTVSHALEHMRNELEAAA